MGPDALFPLSAASIGRFVATVTNTLQQALPTSCFSFFPRLPAIGVPLFAASWLIFRREW